MTVSSAQLGRPVGAVGAQTRARIMTAVMRCVAERGYSRTTIREIARAADMTSGSLYHYFPTKAELLKATLAEIELTAMPRLRAAAARGDDVVERLAAVLGEADRLTREYPYLAAFERAMRPESAGPLRGGPGAVEFRGLRDIIADVIADARRDGSLRGSTDSDGAIDAIYALARGLTERAASLTPAAYRAALRSATQLINGTLFEPRPA